MGRFIFILIVLAGTWLKVSRVWAQNTGVAQVAGNYMLQGVMETAAGFIIKTDGTFEYGFTYGAADKTGKGTWKLSGAKLILNSYAPQTPSDFILNSSVSKPGKGVSITITDAKGRKYRYIKCRLAEGEEGVTDNQGKVQFESIGSGLLELYHPIFSTRLTIIKLNPKHNDFKVYPAYNLSEVFFKNFELLVQPGQLISNRLPGMPPEDIAGQKEKYIFEKQR